jgi:hypothetical protein
LSILFLALLILSSCLRPLDGQAVLQAKKLVGEHIIRCGDSWYTYFHNESFIRELREVRFEVISHDLSPADRANGVEWDGEVTFGADKYRRYDSRSRSWAEWNQWKYVHFVEVSKVKGKWKLSTVGPWSFSTGGLDCGDVPVGQ